MADDVQYRIERMTDELDDLERRGIFSSAEIANIVKRRRNFEYRIHRRSPLKADFVSYIEYEKSLDRLRVLRKENIARVDKKSKKRLSDGAGVRRIIGIYSMAVKKYKGDLDLWFQYLEFCRERKNGRMNQVLADAIKFHPSVPGVWIYAASWEFNHNLNVTAARSLMQSGLRACRNSEDLWTEYLRMELTYLKKLDARKAALGVDVKTLDHASEDTSECAAVDSRNLNEGEGSTMEADLKFNDLQKKEDLFWKHGFRILQTIYHGAVEAIPSSLNLRKRFLEIVDSVDLAHPDELKTEMLNDIEKDFAHIEDYWDWLARYQIKYTLGQKGLTGTDGVKMLNKAIEVYNKSLEKLPTAKMFSLYATFWSEILLAVRDESGLLSQDSLWRSVDFTSSALRVYEKAELFGFLTEELACQYVSYYLQIGNLNKARDLVEKFCDGPLSDSVDLWVLRISIETKDVLSKGKLSFLFNILKSALSELSVSKAERLWLMALKIFSDDRELFEKVMKIAVRSLAKDNGSEAGSSLSCSIISWIFQRDDIKTARKFYKELLALPHPSLKLFRFCVELESNLCSVGHLDSLTVVRDLYESALRNYPQDVELWRDYYLMELKAGSVKNANAIDWRARKTVKGCTGLSVL